MKLGLYLYDYLHYILYIYSLRNIELHIDYTVNEIPPRGAIYIILFPIHRDLHTVQINDLLNSIRI